MGELKGKLLNKLNESAPEFSEEWLKSKIIIKKDGSSVYRFKVENIFTPSIGTFKRRSVKLISLEGEPPINKEFSLLINNLKTSASGWSIEK